MIEFKNVSKTYKTKKGVETKALNNINLKIGNVCRFSLYSRKVR